MAQQSYYQYGPALSNTSHLQPVNPHAQNQLVNLLLYNIPTNLDNTNKESFTGLLRAPKRDQPPMHSIEYASTQSTLIR